MMAPDAPARLRMPVARSRTSLGPAALNGAAALGLVILGLGAWQSFHLAVGSAALASPAASWHRMLELFGREDFRNALAATAVTYAWAVLISVLGGIALGVLFGLSRSAGRVAEPGIHALLAMPKVALYPVVLLVFGLSLPARVTFGVLHGILPVIIFTMQAIANIRPIHLKTAQVLRLSRSQRVLRIVIPAVAPEVLAGVRISCALALLGVVISEMFGASRGLGVLLTTSVALNDTASIMAVNFLLIGFAATVSAILLVLDRALRHA